MPKFKARASRLFAALLILGTLFRPPPRLLRGALLALAASSLAAAPRAASEAFVTGPVRSEPEATNTFASLTVSPGGYFTTVPGDVFVVLGNFLNGSTQNFLWATESSELSLQTGPAHVLTFAGADLGPSYFGYATNFAWGTLRVGLGQSLQFGDGNAVPGAAFYAIRLILEGGVAHLGSLTGNGASIYYDPTDSGNAYLLGRTYPLAGGGVVAPVQAVLQVLQTSRLPNQHLALDCLGVPNRVNRVQASPDLLQPFVTIGSVTADATGHFSFEDAAAGSFPQRFYRVSFP